LRADRSRECAPGDRLREAIDSTSTRTYGFGLARQKPAIHATTVPVAYCDAVMQRKATAPRDILRLAPALERGAVGDTLIVRAVGAARGI